MRPVLPRPAGGHRLHAAPGGGVGCFGEPVPTAACKTLCDRCGLWLGHGLLPVQSGGKTVGDLGLVAGRAAHWPGREAEQGLRWTLDARWEPLGQV